MLQYTVVRFIISGGTATAVTVGSLYVLTDIFGLWYLYGTTIGFSLGMVTSFTLQKLWTFKNSVIDGSVVGKQIALYVTYSIVSVLINDALVYTFVEYVHMWHIVAQVISLGIVAVLSFFVYHFIFSSSHNKALYTNIHTRNVTMRDTE